MWFITGTAVRQEKVITGVPDMTVISDIDVEGINENLHIRYDQDKVYVMIQFYPISS